MKKAGKGSEHFKKSYIMLIFVTILLFIPQQIFADAENDMLKARIEKLEKELKELKSIVNQKDTGSVVETEIKSASASSETSKGFAVKPYGYVKLDASCVVIQ